MKKVFAILALITMFAYAQGQSDVDEWKVDKLENTLDAQAGQIKEVSKVVDLQSNALELITQRQVKQADNVSAIKAALKALSVGKDTTVTIDGEQIKLFADDLKQVVDGGKTIIDDVKGQNPKGVGGYILAIMAVIAKLAGTGFFTAWLTQVTKVYHKLRGWATGKPRSAVVSLAISFVVSLVYHAVMLKVPFDFAAFGVTASVVFTVTIGFYEGILRHTKWFKPVEQTQPTPQA